MGRLLSIKDAASYLNVSQDTLRKWDKANKLKPLKTPGGHRRYDTDTLNEFLCIKEKSKNPVLIKNYYSRMDYIRNYMICSL